MNDRTAELLVNGIVSLLGYIFGHWRGRRVYRSGDYIELHRGEDKEDGL